MKYDTSDITELSAIESNLILTYDYTDTTVSIMVKLLQNLPIDISYNLDLSYLNVIFKGVVGDPYSSKEWIELNRILCEIIEIDIEDDYTVNLVKDFTINKPSSTLKVLVLGRIYLSNNTYFKIDKELTLPEELINTYYNPINI